MHSNLLTLATWALATVNVAEAHYRFSKTIYKGQKSGDFEYIRENSNGIVGLKPFKNAAVGDDLRCNSGTFENAQKTKVLKVAAGDEVGFELWYYATMKHPGPLTIHASKAPGDVREYNGDGDWFKLWEATTCRNTQPGKLQDQDWCSYDKPSINVTVPTEMEPGNYLFRLEHIAIHGASTGDAEFYVMCAQIEVTGSGTGKPSPTVKIPGLYDANDPALRFFIYGAENYPYKTVGQHAVWPSGAGGSNKTDGGSSTSSSSGDSSGEQANGATDSKAAGSSSGQPFSSKAEGTGFGAEVPSTNGSEDSKEDCSRGAKSEKRGSEKKTWRMRFHRADA